MSKVRYNESLKEDIFRHRAEQPKYYMKIKEKNCMKQTLIGGLIYKKLKGKLNKQKMN